MEQFLDDPQNAETSGAILEDFRRINDIAVDSTNLLVQAYQWAGAAFDQEHPVQELAMRLFLDHPDAFKHAWSRYLFFSTGAKLSFYPLDLPPLNITEKQVERFRADLDRWLSSQAKGRKSLVHWFQEEDLATLHIERGSYLRTMARWREDRIEIDTFRPVTEDLLVYNTQHSTLTIKASLAKDREFYLQALAYHFGEDGSLARTAMDTPMFSLNPIQQEKFDYTGNGMITGVQLVKARMRLNDQDSSEVEIKSKDVLGALRRSLKGFSIDQGQLTAARLRFQVQPDDGRPETVSLDIEPPARTDLAQKRHADIIDEYLQEQGVKLR